MKLILLISLLIINGCTPLFTAGGLMHSVVTNNTVSTVLGLGDIAIKDKTGKNVNGHLLDKFFRNKEVKSNNNKNNKDVKWVFEKIKLFN